MNTGDSMDITVQQAAILFGHPVNKISQGVRGNWVGMEMEVAGVTGDSVQIKRIASGAQGISPTVGSDADFHELDSWNDGGATETDRNGGLQTRPKLGPVDIKVLKPGESVGGGMEEKVDILGPELKSPRDQRFPFSNPSQETPRMDQQKYANALEILENIKRLRAADGLDKPIIAVRNDKSGVK